MNNENECPNCNEDWNGVACEACGFAIEIGANEYETPEGNIAHCTEEEAFERGYISICPECLFNVITHWEKEDHGKCIECWHKVNQYRNEADLPFTNPPEMV